MNSYEDVVRRIHFMAAEILRLGHDLGKYQIVLGRQLFVDFMQDAPPLVAEDHLRRQSHLLGYRLSLVDRPGQHLALFHEVLG